jgi:hypothetical protein
MTRVDLAASNETKNLSIKAQASEEKLVEIQIQLAVIQKDLLYIRQLLDAHMNSSVGK